MIPPFRDATACTPNDCGITETDMAATETLEQTFQKAVRFYESGNLKKALKCLTDIQRKQPDIPDVLHLLGLVTLRLDKPKDAAKYLENLADLVSPSANILGLLGSAFNKAGRGEEAIQVYEQALQISSDQAENYFNLGNVYRDLGRSDEAIVHYRKAQEKNPQFVDAYVNLGIVYKNAEQYDNAAEAFRSAIKLDPADGWAYASLGNVYQEQGKFDEAVKAHEKSFETNPESMEFMNNLASSLAQAGLPEKSIALYREALETHPESLELACGLGTAYTALGNTQKAKAAYRAALRIFPEDPMAKYLFGRVMLLEGSFQEAWEGLDSRWEIPELKTRTMVLPQPQWKGEDLSGKSILVWGEQGVGDEVMYSGMIPDLLERGARVSLECDSRLIPIYCRSFPNVEYIPRSDPPEPAIMQESFDYHTPSGSLARWLRPDENAFPSRQSFLQADSGHVQTLRERYGAGTDNKLIGITWKSKNVKFGDHKSMSLKMLSPITRIPGLTFVDLQYGETAQERKSFAEETGVEILHEDTIDQMEDLDIFAAQIAAMDLVISISNTTVHLAGALGVPCWLLLNKVPLNCWMLDRKDSPWYPSLTLFRQTQSGQWEDVVDKVAGNLSEFIHTAPAR